MRRNKQRYWYGLDEEDSVAVLVTSDSKRPAIPTMIEITRKEFNTLVTVGRRWHEAHGLKMQEDNVCVPMLYLN